MSVGYMDMEIHVPKVRPEFSPVLHWAHWRTNISSLRQHLELLANAPVRPNLSYVCPLKVN